MTPRPFYRSRLFWLGLPGLVFLLWFGHGSGVGFGGTRPWAIVQTAGDLLVVWDSEEWPDWQSLGNSTEVALYSQGEHPTYRYVFIPYYAVALAYITAWLLTLAWWHRRKSRLMKLHTAP